jgi:hypothetical protein
MDSSISHSKFMPKVAAGLLVVALLSWGASAFYTLRFNPELAFFRHANVLKQNWQSQMRQQYGSNIVFCGGSSCFTGIDAKHIQTRYGLPVVNMGFGAGMGPKVLGQLGLGSVRSGDTLILAFEPGLLGQGFEVPTLGSQFLLATDFSRAFGSLRVGQIASTLLALRPGGYHAFTLFGKMILHKPMYRYGLEEVREGGWHAVADRRDVSPSAPVQYQLSQEGRNFLRETAAWCATNNVRLAFTLPWIYHLPQQAEEARSKFKVFQAEVNQFMAVFKDPFAGCYTVREAFADSNLHLIPNAAMKRSDELARELLRWDVYERGTLPKQ